MNRLKILIIISAVFSLSGCNAADNDFAVEDHRDIASSAEIKICGKIEDMPKSQGIFRKRMPIDCEGEGSIRVRLANKREIYCRIGYVTPGLEQTFKFAIADRQCR